MLAASELAQNFRQFGQNSLIQPTHTFKVLRHAPFQTRVEKGTRLDDLELCDLPISRSCEYRSRTILTILKFGPCVEFFSNVEHAIVAILDVTAYIVETLCASFSCCMSVTPPLLDALPKIPRSTQVTSTLSSHGQRFRWLCLAVLTQSAPWLS